MTEMTPAQERASRAATELTKAVIDLCAEQYGNTHGDYAVIIQAMNYSENFTFTWDWFVKPHSPAQES